MVFAVDAVGLYLCRYALFFMLDLLFLASVYELAAESCCYFCYCAWTDSSKFFLLCLWTDLIKFVEDELIDAIYNCEADYYCYCFYCMLS